MLIHCILILIVDKTEETVIEGSDKAKTGEEATSVVNKATDVQCERFAEAVRVIRELSENALKQAEDLKEALLEENEKKYCRLCDDVLAMEENEKNEENEDEKKKDEPPAKKKKPQSIPDELCFPRFGEDFFDWILRRYFILTSF